MHEMIGHALSVFMGFFAIMTPIANTPIFLSLTADDAPAIRMQVAMKAVITAFGLILVFCLLGKLIFSLFGITLPAFRITGGLLVALIGYNMLHGEPSKVHHSGSVDQKVSTEAELSVAVTPLAIPILAGPGTIATAMNLASTPEEMDRLDRRIIQLKIEREALKKESDEASKRRLADLEAELSALEREYADLEEVWRPNRPAFSARIHQPGRRHGGVPPVAAQADPTYCAAPGRHPRPSSGGAGD